MRDDSNQPAFPCSLANKDETELTGFAGEVIPPNKTAVYSGLSLRDYFASKALQGLLSRGYSSGCEYNSRLAYEFADAMMKARQE